MAEKTSNHALNIYQIGDENWTHAPDMETLEERLWVRDVANNRHNYVAYKNGTYLATDTGEVYLGNGQEWERLGTISGSQGSSVDSHIIESFSDGTLNRYEGDTDVFSVVSGDIAGDYMLQFQDDAGNKKLIWNDGIQTQRGNSYAAYFRANGVASPGLIVCGQVDGSGNLHAGYGVVISTSRDEVRLVKEPTDADEGFFWNTLDMDTPVINEGMLYRAEIDLGFNTIQARLVDEEETVIATLSGADSEFSTGPLAWRDASGQGGISNFDHGMCRPHMSVHLTSASNGSSGSETGNDPGHNWINVVSDHRADPTGADDSAEAIQNAIDAAAPNGTVFIPSGIYMSDQEIVLTSSHQGVTLCGEGYSSHIEFTANVTNGLRIRDTTNPIYNITVENLRLSNADYANMHVDWDNHMDSMGIAINNLWSHDSGRGLLLAGAGSYVDGLRVWNCSHNGLSLSGQDEELLDRWPQVEQWRWANNIMAWNCRANGIDISKQAGWVTNFICKNNSSGMKFSNYGHGRGLMNGYLIENDGDGMRHTGGDSLQTITMDNVWSLRNGQNPGGIYGDGIGFNIRNANYRIGHIYAGDNNEFGVMCGSGDIVIDQLVSENNGDRGLYVQSDATVDIMHLSGSGNSGGLFGGNQDNLWVLRSRDYTNSEY